jgi:hypothetical protein
MAEYRPDNPSGAEGASSVAAYAYYTGSSWRFS